MKVILEHGINYFFYYDAVSSVMLILEKLAEVKDLIEKVKKLDEVHVLK